MNLLNHLNRMTLFWLLIVFELVLRIYLDYQKMIPNFYKNHVEKIKEVNDLKLNVLYKKKRKILSEKEDLEHDSENASEKH